MSLTRAPLHIKQRLFHKHTRSRFSRREYALTRLDRTTNVSGMPNEWMKCAPRKSEFLGCIGKRNGSTGRRKSQSFFRIVLPHSFPPRQRELTVRLCGYYMGLGRHTNIWRKHAPWLHLNELLFTHRQNENFVQLLISLYTNTWPAMLVYSIRMRAAGLYLFHSRSGLSARWAECSRVFDMFCECALAHLFLFVWLSSFIVRRVCFLSFLFDACCVCIESSIDRDDSWMGLLFVSQHECNAHSACLCVCVWAIVFDLPMNFVCSYPCYVNASHSDIRNLSKKPETHRPFFVLWMKLPDGRRYC